MIPFKNLLKLGQIFDQIKYSPLLIFLSYNVKWMLIIFFNSTWLFLLYIVTVHYTCNFKNLFIHRIIKFFWFVCWVFFGWKILWGGKQVWLGKNLLVLQGERVKIAYVHILGPTCKLAVEKSLLNNILLLDNYLFF